MMVRRTAAGSRGAYHGIRLPLNPGNFLVSIAPPATRHEEIPRLQGKTDAVIRAAAPGCGATDHHATSAKVQVGDARPQRPDTLIALTQQLGCRAVSTCALSTIAAGGTPVAMVCAAKGVSKSVSCFSLL